MSEVHPAATNLNVRLIHEPPTGRAKAIPALLELRRIMLHPAQDGARCEGDTAFGHHRHEVSVREFVLEVPAHAQDDELGIEMAAFEDFGEAQHHLAPFTEEASNISLKVRVATQPFRELWIGLSVASREVRIVWIGATGSAPGVGTIKGLKQAFGPRVRTIATDTNPRLLVPASKLADSFHTIDPVDSDTFVATLTDVLEAEKVDILVPIHDREIEAVMQHREELPPQVSYACAATQTVLSVGDKLTAYDWMRARDIPTPVTLRPEDFSTRDGDWVVKPRHGLGGVNFRRLTQGELPPFADDINGWIVQAACGGPELTVDCFRARNSDYLFTLARERLEVKAGVCTKARLFFSQELSDLAARVAHAFDLQGAFCFQVMTGAHGGFQVTDINPRVGGATAMSLVVGSNFFAANIAEFLGESPEAFLMPFTGDRYVCRLYEEIATNG